MAILKHSDPTNQWTWCAGCVIGSLLIFLSDMYTPPGFAHGGLYLLLLMMASASRSKRVVVGVAALSILLAITGAILDTPGAMMMTVIANRTSSVLAIAIFTLTWIMLQQQYNKLQADSLKYDPNILTLQQAANSMPSLIWTTNSSDRTDFVNAGLMEFFRLDSAARFEGKSWTEVLLGSKAAAVLPAWQQCLAEGRHYRAEMTIERHDGVRCRHLVDVVPVHDENNVINHWYGLAVNLETPRPIVSSVTPGFSQPFLQSL